MKFTTVADYWKAMETRLLEIQTPEQVEAMKHIFYSGAAAYHYGVQAVMKIDDRAIGKAALDTLETEVTDFFQLKQPEPSRIITP